MENELDFYQQDRKKYHDKLVAALGDDAKKTWGMRLGVYVLAGQSDIPIMLIDSGPGRIHIRWLLYYSEVVLYHWNEQQPKQSSTSEPVPSRSCTVHSRTGSTCIYRTGKTMKTGTLCLRGRAMLYCMQEQNLNQEIRGKSL
jgi:hypothetical protein